MPALAYPLSHKRLQEAFAALHPGWIQVRSHRGFQDAVVDGAWTLPVLRQRLRLLGLEPVEHSDGLLWTNSAQDVGVQIFGIDRHPRLPTWKTYTIEVQARRSISSKAPVHFG